ncbi:nuclear transport factor 2 family protein [Psychroserpens algicola]|uniref:Nuclear transport factor 2 family protein n=1 Tax=Psychroserpens algicola TaxID=1719034 RepID=A0ABT0H5Z0_9FLAO|nr:nuclear transport factor 2 family protein [Psychroserpens algicola]MCK8479793.1 nuclear transport factor 2 family protein [Psychroserpens algicola]
MENRINSAKEYFEAFHDGKLEKVFTYFNDKGTIQYGTEQPAPAEIFFPNSAELISTFNFKTHAIYSSKNSGNIIIHFSFHPKSDPNDITEAIDIIEFDENDKITKILVIPNSKN